jgi:hypothetical protein
MSHLEMIQYILVQILIWCGLAAAIAAALFLITILVLLIIGTVLQFTDNRKKKHDHPADR